MVAISADGDRWLGAEAPPGPAVERPAGGHLRSRLGREAEEAAHRLLLESGYLPVARNVRCRFGEIDVVAKEGRTLVFVEVKSRRLAGSEDAFAASAEAIAPAKQRRLRRLAEWYLLREGIGPETPVRFDAVVVDLRQSGVVRRTRLIRDAF